MRARLMSGAARALFPEIFGGMYTDLEMVDSDPNNDSPAVIVDGEVTIIPKDQSK